MIVECLACGCTRRLARLDGCPRCGYPGWARVDRLSESERRSLRERPLETRRLRPVA